MSKTGWIILIVCLCLVFCLCAGLFLAGRISTWLFRDRSETHVDTGTTKEYKDLKNDYSADGVYTIQTKDLKELTIDWISGSVIVEITDGEVIRITETASEPIQEKEKKASEPKPKSRPSTLIVTWQKLMGKIDNLSKDIDEEEI